MRFKAPEMTGPAVLTYPAGRKQRGGGAAGAGRTRDLVQDAPFWPLNPMAAFFGRLLPEPCPSLGLDALG